MPRDQLGQDDRDDRVAALGVTPDLLEQRRAQVPEWRLDQNERYLHVPLVPIATTIPRPPPVRSAGRSLRPSGVERARVDDGADGGVVDRTEIGTSATGAGARTGGPASNLATRHEWHVGDDDPRFEEQGRLEQERRRPGTARRLQAIHPLRDEDGQEVVRRDVRRDEYARTARTRCCPRPRAARARRAVARGRARLPRGLESAGGAGPEGVRLARPGGPRAGSRSRIVAGP